MAIVRPIIVIGSPRSGTTILFSILSSHPDLWSLYRESTGIIEKFFPPQKSGWKKGHALHSEDAANGLAEVIRAGFYRNVVNYQAIFPNLCSPIYANKMRERLTRGAFHTLCSPLLKPSSIRIVEKTPRNCLRIPFLHTVFPDAFFVFLKRDPRTNISSLMQGWRAAANRYATSYDLPGGVQIEGYAGTQWSFVLPPGWEEYARGRNLQEVCAFQYSAANRAALEDLANISQDCQLSLRYEDLISNPEGTVEQFCDAAGLAYTGGLKRMAQRMPAVNTTEAPSSAKWRKNEKEVLSVLPALKHLSARLGYG